MTKIKSVSMTIIYFESGFQINAELSFYIISIDITIMRFIIVSKFWLSYTYTMRELHTRVILHYQFYERYKLFKLFFWKDIENVWRNGEKFCKDFAITYLLLILSKNLNDFWAYLRLVMTEIYNEKI